MFASYYCAAASRAFSAALEWPNSHSIPFALLAILLGAVSAIVVSKFIQLDRIQQPRWLLALERLGLVALSGLLLAFCGCFIVFFLSDTPAQIQARDDKIAALGGAPDAPVNVPRFSTSVAEKVDRALSNLSDVLNKQMRSACAKSERVQLCIQEIRVSDLAGCEKAARDLFTAERAIDEMLRGTSANSGLLNASEPEIVRVLNEAIQGRDRRILIDFDSSNIAVYSAFNFMSLLPSSGEDRTRLLEPAINIVGGDLNRWEDARRSYCGLIDKTNARISDIRTLMR